VTGTPGPDDLRPLVGQRMTQYVALWEEASAKLAAGSYRSEDLVSDWFRWMGLATRDATATWAVAFGPAAASAATASADEAHEAPPPPTPPPAPPPTPPPPSGHEG
jgi:hypothetical protein